MKMKILRSSVDFDNRREHIENQINVLRKQKINDSRDIFGVNI
jgi:hypothetical protein